MPKVLIICAHRPGRSPSQRYRFEQYLPFLEDHDFFFTWSYLLNEKDDRSFYAQGNTLLKASILIKNVFTRLKDLRRVNEFDLVFIQRESMFLGSSFFEKRTARSSARIIFDFDDSIWLADTSPGNKKWEWIKRPAKFFDSVSLAHTVIAGNQYLADKARTLNKNTVIIPTTIDTKLHIPQPALRNKPLLCIGWSGSISTVKHFEGLLPVLKKLNEKYKGRIHFKMLGDAGYKNSSLEIEALAWTASGEVGILNTFDIGVMPLPDDEWAMGKCGLKALSYMACGIPSVMSAVGVNKNIIRNGVNGFLANNEQEWLDRLSELIEQKELRTRLGEAGRKTVEEKFSVEANKRLYLEVLKNTMK